MDAAECIGCGACVAACPNASASLFTAAKISHLSLLPQGQAERSDRARKMVAQMDAEGFGGCTNHGECEAACPKGVSLRWIARMNRDFVRVDGEGRHADRDRASARPRARGVGVVNEAGDDADDRDHDEDQRRYGVPFG